MIKGYQRKNRIWNTRPNNDDIPSPFENPPISENNPFDKVFLVELIMSNWCRLHKTN